MTNVRLHMRTLEPADAGKLSNAFADIGWSKPVAQFRTYLREQEAGERWACVAEWDGALAGYVTLRWFSEDPVLLESGVPEIVDLNVLPEYRRHGIGRALLHAAEVEAATRASTVGLRAGLHAGYGAALRLYVLAGYVPDGTGALIDGEEVEEGAMVELGDDLTIRMTKSLATCTMPMEPRRS